MNPGLLSGIFLFRKLLLALGPVPYKKVVKKFCLKQINYGRSYIFPEIHFLARIRIKEFKHNR